MIYGIMQPYFFPYIGYFSLIKYSDSFVFFDTPQYINHGWVNRNRVLKQDGTPNYIIVPVQKAPRETPIMDMKIRQTEDWRKKIFGQLDVYRKKAPYFTQTMDFLHSVLDTFEGDSLAKLNCMTTEAVSRYLGIQTPFAVSSEQKLALPEVKAPDEWALYITKALGGDVYVNPPGGMSFFDESKYTAAGIELQFLKSNLTPYVQRVGHFEPGLSIIDVMMYNDIPTINRMLDDFEILHSGDLPAGELSKTEADA